MDRGNTHVGQTARLKLNSQHILSFFCAKCDLSVQFQPEFALHQHEFCVCRLHGAKEPGELCEQAREAPTRWWVLLAFDNDSPENAPLLPEKEYNAFSWMVVSHRGMTMTHG